MTGPGIVKTGGNSKQDLVFVENRNMIKPGTLTGDYDGTFQTLQVDSFPEDDISGAADGTGGDYYAEGNLEVAAIDQKVFDYLNTFTVTSPATNVCCDMQDIFEVTDYRDTPQFAHHNTAVCSFELLKRAASIVGRDRSSVAYLENYKRHYAARQPGQATPTCDSLQET